MEESVRYQLFAPSHLEKRILKGTTVIQTEKYPFQKATKKEVFKARFQKNPLVILKFEDKFYLCYLPIDTFLPMDFIRTDHLCSYCDRCSAANDEKGGCHKVRDYTLTTSVHFYSILNSTTSNEYDLLKRFPQEFKKARKKAFLKAVLKSKRIEKYPFIDYGLETIHMKPNLFLVLECQNFKPYPSPKYENSFETKTII